MNPQGKCALVTGSTDGVGRVVAHDLAAQGARVIVHGRDRARGREVVREITERGGTATFLQADFASLTDVRECAAAVLEYTDRVHILVNNAGIGTSYQGRARQESPDGVELRFAVNYLAGFLLTRLLLPTVRASAPARIVFVASIGQQAIDFDDVMLTNGYSGTRAYCQSKLAQIMCAFDLAHELAGTGVTVNALHPATFMPTTMVREAGVQPSSTIRSGADAILQLAVSPEVEGVTGEYFEGLQRSRANAQAYSERDRITLRELSFRLAGLD